MRRVGDFLVRAADVFEWHAADNEREANTLAFDALIEIVVL